MSWAWLPASTMRPPSSTRIWSAILTVERRWLISSPVFPVMSSRKCWKSRYSASASSAEAGSSRITRAASRRKLRASATFCHSPAERRRVVVHQGSAIEQDQAAGGIVHPRQQLDQVALAGPVAPHQRGPFARREPRVDPLEYRRRLTCAQVVEVDILQLNSLLEAT